MADEKEIRILISAEAQTAAISRVNDQLAQMRKQTDAVTQSTTEGIKRQVKAFDDLEKTASRIRTVSIVISAAGTSILATGMGLAKGYVQAVQTNEAVSRQWLWATRELERAQLRLGRVFAQEMVPYMQKAAQFVDSITAFAEKHPEVVRGAIGVGTGLAVAGGTGLALSSALSLWNKVKPLFGGVGTAATAAGAAIAGSPLALALLLTASGTGLGLGVNELLANTEFGKRIGLQKANVIATVGAYGLGRLFGGEETGLAWAKFVGQLTGAIENMGGASSKTAKEIDFTLEQLQIYYAYQRQEVIAQRQLRINLQRMQRDFQRQVRYEEEDFYRRRRYAIQDYQRQETYALQDYYRQRAIMVRDYGIEMARAEEDFQRSRRRAQEDFEFQMWDILRSGDALAWMRAQRQFNITQQRAEEDYRIAQQRRAEDFQRQLQDMETQFAIQRARRAEEFKIQLQREEEEFQIRQKRAREQFATQLNDMMRNYNEERLLRRQALIDQLRDLAEAGEKERLLRQQLNNVMLEDLRNVINQAQRAVNLIIPSRQSGGYVGEGLYYAHGNEFVINAQTTALIESRIGRKLDQAVLLSAVSGKEASSGGTIIWNDYRQFDSRVTPEEREAILRDTEYVLSKAIQELVRR